MASFRLFLAAYPLLATLALIIVASRPAHADPIPVTTTTGTVFLSMSGGEELSFVVLLPGIGEVTGYTAVDQGLDAEAFPPPLALQPGALYTVSSTATFSSGQIMLNGASGPVIPAWRVSGAFNFEGGTGPLVAEEMPWGTQYVATAPFSFTGWLNQYDWGTGALLDTFLLTGRGTGRGFFHDYPGAPSPPVVGYVSYSFEDQQPVPEPATLLLTLTGLSAAALRRRRRGADRADQFKPGGGGV